MTVDGIDVRTLRLSQTDPDAFAACLAPAEEARARRFARPDDRDRFRLGRGLLRTLLGSALGRAPASLDLRADAQGKPVLAGESRLAFNVSHSGDLVMVAMGEAGAVGVDVECARESLDPLALGPHVFGPEEQARVERSAAADRPKLFLDLWVLKEALLKGVGTGFLGDPRAVEIAPGPDRPRVRFLGRAGADPAAGWSLRLLDAPAGYHAALAVLPHAGPR